MEGLDLLRVLQSIFGIGLVVFVHELGHFLAARLCKVRVETFSLGFGPKLVAWRPGPTTYQIALVPLGGYCKMAGEERRFDGLPPAADELPARSVEQRFFIYAAGVMMNVAFVLVLFPILFRVGVPFVVPRIGAVAPGGPAWQAGVEPGSEVLEVNGNEVFEFNQIRTEVYHGGGAPARVLLREPGSDEPRLVEVRPRRDERLGLFMLGIESALESDDAGAPLLEVRTGSPAWQAGLRTGDALVGVEGAPAWLSPRDQFAERSAESARVALRIRNERGESVLHVEPELLETGVRRVGIRPPSRYVAAVRGPEAARVLGVEPGDRVLSVAGVPIRRSGDLRRALAASVAGDAVELQRAQELRRHPLPPLTPELVERVAENVALAPDVDATWIIVQSGEPAALAGLEDGDRVLAIDGAETERWEDVFALVRAAADEGRAAAFDIERQDADGSLYRTLRVTPEPALAADYGVLFRRDEYVYRSETVGEAVSFGFYSSWKLLEELWWSLKSLVTAEVSADNVTGVVGIAQFSYAMAEAGWTKFFFFLCFLSMNLAFINLLPIPVLDGGHLFFLVVEKIKGSPVSERVLGYSQMVGVVLILSLMIYVTYNDILRLLPGP